MLRWLLFTLILIPRPAEASSQEATRHEQQGAKYLLEGRLDDAERELLRCVRIDPKSASCHRHLGVLFAKTGDEKRSVHHYRAYVTLDPYADDAGQVRKIIEKATGEVMPAPPPKYDTPSPAPSPGRSVSKELERLARNVGDEGKRALMDGKLKRAETLLLACVELNPSAAGCHRSLGVFYAKKDDTKKAIEHYKRYVALAPNGPDAEQVRRMISDAERRR